MKKLNAILAAVLALCLAAAVVVEEVRIGTLRKENAALTARVAALEAQPANLEAKFDSTEPAAEFEGGIVTVGEAARAYAEIAAYYELAGANEADYADSAKREVLASLAEDKILLLKAQQLGVDKLSDAEQQQIESAVRESYEENVSYYMAFRASEGKTEEQLRNETIAYLEENGYTYEAQLKEATSDIWRERLYAEVTKDVSVTDDSIRTLYENEVETAKIRYTADFSEYEYDVQFGETVLYHPEGIRNVQAVLIGFTPEQARRYVQLQDALEAGDSNRLAEIDVLYQELMPRAQEVLDRAAQGEDFAALIDDYSDDAELAAEPARSEGIPVAAQSTIYEDAFINGAMALSKIGDVSGMIYVDAGIYILRYTSDVPSGAADFASVRTQLAQTGVEEIRMAEYNRAVEAWLDEANIRYYPERI